MSVQIFLQNTKRVRVDYDILYTDYTPLNIMNVHKNLC